MRLSDYLESRGMNIAEGARSAGFEHETFRKWVKGLRRPRKAEDVQRIAEWSDGAVTAADWYAVATEAA